MTSKLKYKPSEVMVKFLKERVESNQGISLQKLTGHLSQLPPDVRNKYGCSVKSLKSFLQQHPQTFRIVNDNNVCVTNGEKRSSLKSSLNGSVESIPTSTSDHGGGSSDGPAESADEVTTLSNVKGKVYRLFNVFGFISVTYPIKTSVYFDVQAFENGEYANLSASGLQLGECVVLDAKVGPRDCEAKFRASKVARLENASNESSTQSMPQNVDTTGTVQKVQEKYGFIKFGRNNRERAFFHLNNIHRPPGVEITALPDILTVDDKVRFKAKPSKKSTEQVKWEATVVYVPQFSKKGEMTPGDSYSDDESGNEVFMSDDESDIAQFLQQKLEDSHHDESSPAATYDWDRASVEEDPQVECSNMSFVGDSDEWDQLPKRSGEKGQFVPKTDTEGEIIFREEVVRASSDVTFCNGEPVGSLLWEIRDKEEVLFDAVRSQDGIWIATLVWTGTRPTVPPVSKDTFYKRLRALEGDKVSNDNSWDDGLQEQKSSTKGQPCISVHSDVKGKVVKVMEYVGYCEFQVNNTTRKEQFMSDRFYQDGKPCSDLTKVLRVGDEIWLEYILGVDGTEEKLHLDLCWQGPRPPRVEPQMTPEQFAQALGNFGTSLEDDDDDDEDLAPFQGISQEEEPGAQLEQLQLPDCRTYNAKEPENFVESLLPENRKRVSQVTHKQEEVAAFPSTAVVHTCGCTMYNAGGCTEENSCDFGRGTKEPSSTTCSCARCSNTSQLPYPGHQGIDRVLQHAG
ncbi:uncharacterized protein LOC135396539 isoform X2 [Ornithodoros turicata]|uniref:uncharacterized protein LOC135396539 isoform X2 n=1 Tax=Ornithodoros turicata TaxID=34597 RepID=UPI00313A450D